MEPDGDFKALGFMMMRVLKIGLSLALFGMATLLPAAQSGEVARFAYVANPYDYTLLQYIVTDDGRLLPNGMAFAKDKFPATVAVHPNNRFVYSVSRTNDLAPIFNIDPKTGRLTENPFSHFDTRLRSPVLYRFHPNNKFLYVAGRGGGVGGFSVNPDTGEMVAVPGSPFKSGERTRSLTIHPSGKFLYASNAYTNDVSAYHINPLTGALSQLKNSPFHAGEEGPFDDTYAKLPDVNVNRGGLPYYIDAHPSGKFVYVTNWMAASVSMFRVNESTGDLTLIERPMETGLTPYAVASHPSGKYLYVSTWGGNDLWGYHVDPQSGKLTHIEGSPFAVQGQKPVDITFNKDGTLVYTANNGSMNVSVMDVDVASGKLRFKDMVMSRAGAIDIDFAYGAKPVSVIPEFLFGLDETGAKLNMFQPADNAFKHLGSAATGKQPVAIASDPQNRFVYVANKGNNTISGFKVHANGEMQPIKGLPLEVAQPPDKLLIDANGWFLYVLNGQSNTITVYLIHMQTGQLAEVQGSPLKLEAQAHDIVLDPTARFLYVLSDKGKSVAVYRFREAITPALFEIVDYGSPFAFEGQPDVLRIDATGRFAVIIQDKHLELRLVHVSSGALVPANEALPKAKAVRLRFKEKILDAAFSVYGDYVYVLTSNRVQVYQVNRINGALTAQGKGFALQQKAKGLLMDPSGKQVYVVTTDKQLQRLDIDSESGLITRLHKVSLSHAAKFPAFSRLIQ